MAAKQFFNPNGSISDLLRMLAPLTIPGTALNDATDLPFKPRAVHVSVAGNVKYTAAGVTLTELWEVGWHPVQPDRIWATGTAATLVYWM